MRWKGVRCTRVHGDPCWRCPWQGGLLLLLLVAQISYLCNGHTGRNPGGRYDRLRKHPHTGSQVIGRKGRKMCMHLTMAMPPTCQNVGYIARLYPKNGYRGEGRSLDKDRHYIYPKWLSSFFFLAPSHIVMRCFGGWSVRWSGGWEMNNVLWNCEMSIYLSYEVW